MKKLSAIICGVVTTISVSVSAANDPGITTGYPQTGDNDIQTAKRIAYSQAQIAAGTQAVSALVLANGTNAAIAPTANVMYVSGPTTNCTLAGFSGGYDGRRIRLLDFTGATNFTIQCESTSDVATNRIATFTAADVAGWTNGTYEFMYFSRSNRWVFLGKQYR